jgi:hypothetical protein
VPPERFSVAFYIGGTWEDPQGSCRDALEGLESVENGYFDTLLADLSLGLTTTSFASDVTDKRQEWAHAQGAT